MFRILIVIAALNTGCLSTSHVLAEKYKAHLYGEGIIYDSSNSEFFVSSARTGTIGKVTLSGSYSVFYSDSNLLSTYGLRIDYSRNRLYVCAGNANFSEFSRTGTWRKIARLIAIDLKSRQKVEDYDLSALNPGEHFPKNLCLDSSGNLYVTDNFSNVIYKVSNGATEIFSRSPLFRINGPALTGITWHPGGFLIVSNSASGDLYKIETGMRRRVSKVTIADRFVGADDLAMNGETLTIVVNGRKSQIFHVISSDNWLSASVQASVSIDDREDYPSTATFNGSNIWLVNTRYNDVVDSTTFPLTFPLSQVTLGLPVNK